MAQQKQLNVEAGTMGTGKIIKKKFWRKNGKYKYENKILNLFIYIYLNIIMS